jgi:hypothetical protein
VHLVWTTYERSVLIRHDIEQALWALITAQCKKLSAVALRISGIALSKLETASGGARTSEPSRAQPASAGFVRVAGSFRARPTAACGAPRTVESGTIRGEENSEFCRIFDGLCLKEPCRLTQPAA